LGCDLFLIRHIPRANLFRNPTNVIVISALTGNRRLPLDDEFQQFLIVLFFGGATADNSELRKVISQMIGLQSVRDYHFRAQSSPPRAHVARQGRKPRDKFQAAPRQEYVGERAFGAAFKKRCALSAGDIAHRHERLQRFSLVATFPCAYGEAQERAVRAE
jgi:hypothetical protein